MPFTRTPGLVLQRIPYSESSLILKVFTRESGLVSLIAKGAKRPKSQFAGLLDFYAEYELIYRLRDQAGLTYLSKASLSYDFEKIRTDLHKMSLANVYLEIFLRYIQGQETSVPLYETLAGALEELENNDCPPSRLPMYSCDFLLLFCSLMGFQPQFHNCSHCGGKTARGSFTFDLEMGGPACRECESNCRSPYKNIHSDIFQWLAGMTEYGVFTKDLHPRKMSQGEVMLISFLRVQTGKPEPLKSYKFYRGLMA